MRLTDKTAVLTGGAGGIGAATARRFVAEGAQVLIVDRDIDGATSLAEDLGPAATAVACDVRLVEDVIKVANTARELWGRVDVLVNNAGTELSASYDETTLAEWERVIETDLRAPWLFCKYIVPGMVERGSGSVVNVASLNSLVGFPNCAAYGAAKGGLAVFTLDMAIELATSGVRFNAVAPGVIDTPMIRRWRDSQDGGGGNGNAAAALEAVTALMPIRRMGRPEEVAAAILFFASDDSTLCQGAILPVDGGYVAQ